MELVKTQMQVCGKDGISDVVRDISRRAGLGGLARGLAVTVTREVPAFGVYFGSYELMIRSDDSHEHVCDQRLAGSWVTAHPRCWSVAGWRVSSPGCSPSLRTSSSPACRLTGSERPSSTAGAWTACREVSAQRARAVWSAAWAPPSSEPSP